MAEADALPRNLDDIRVFLGEIPEEEHQLRMRLRSARNCASFRLTTAESEHARQLLWICCETASAWVYAPADDAVLKNISEYCRRLMIVAEQAEAIARGD